MIKPTKKQQAIITEPPAGRLWVEAGPGTGKTEAVARRLAWLLGPGGVRPSELLVLSFSRSAVRALITRVSHLEGQDALVLEDLRHLSVRTFDSWAFRVLRLLGHDAAELLQGDYTQNIGRALEALRKRETEDLLKNELVNLHRIRHLVVDEVQDLTGLRAELVLELLERIAPPASGGCGFTLLGDSHQAIYGFSSDGRLSEMTAPKFKKAVHKHWKKELVEHSLTENHRSSGATAERVELARAALDGAVGTKSLEFMRSVVQKLPTAQPVELVDDIQSGAKGVAILCRDNQQIAGMISHMQYLAYTERLELPPIRLLTGRTPKGAPPWVAAVLHPVTAAQLTKSQFERIWKHLKREGAALESWRLLARAAGGTPEATSIDMAELRRRLNWPDSFPDDEGLPEDALTVTTIHQSKGLEYERVCLVERSKDYEPEILDEEEEGRVLFVGLSRARSEAQRVEAGKLRPFGRLECGDGQKRWYQALPQNLKQLELGCDGDIDEESIVRADRMGGEAAVKAVQQLFVERADDLVGRAITLVKTDFDDQGQKKVYRIDLNQPIGPVTSLGFLDQRVTWDILKFIDHRRHSLPGKIFSLRVLSLATVAWGAEIHKSVPAPWRQSRVWLVPVLHGIARMKLFPKSGG